MWVFYEVESGKLVLTVSKGFPDNGPPTHLLEEGQAILDAELPIDACLFCYLVVDGEVVHNAAHEEVLKAEARKTMKLSLPQLLIGLATMEWITPAEGMAWAKAEGLPSEIEAMIATLPPAHQFAATVRALRMSEAERLDSLVLALAAGREISADDMDVFFTTFGAV